MSDRAFEFDIEAPDLPGLLAHVKEFDPKLATGLRRELRATGDATIAEIRAVLSGSLPGSITPTGHTYRRIVPRNGRKPYFARRVDYKLGAAKTSTGVGDLRSQISQGLRTRVVAGRNRQSISIRTNGPRNDGYNMARTWAKRWFRHPVFGHGWVDQQGQDYFWSPVNQNLTAMQDRIADVIDDALARLAQK